MGKSRKKEGRAKIFTTPKEPGGPYLGGPGGAGGHAGGRTRKERTVMQEVVPSPISPGHHAAREKKEKE